MSRSVPGESGSAGSRFEIAPNGDARIAIDRRVGGAHVTGTILLIGGRWMLTQGFDAPAVRAIFVARPTYSPNLYQQMVGE